MAMKFTGKLPITGQKISSYIDFLAKGQYFKITGYPLIMNRSLITFQFINKKVISYLELNYKKQHGSEPIADLQRHPNAETIAGGECVIFSDKKNYLFFFQEGMAFIITIKRRNKNNIRRKDQYLQQFRWKNG